MKKFTDVFLRVNLVSLAICLFCLNISFFAQTVEPTALEIGKAVEREIANPEKHTYKINVPSGNYLVVNVDQKVDVIVTVFDLTGKKIQEVDNPYGIQLAETVRLISETSADYLIEVKILEPKSNPGSYKIELKTLHPATEEDKTRMIAENYFSEANIAYTKGTAEAYKITEEKLNLSLPLFRQLGDKKREHYVIDRLGRVYNQIGDKKKSQEYHFQALELARTMGDKIFIARSLDAIGVTYYTQGESRKAIEYWSQVLEMYRERNDQSLITATLNNIGAAYNNLGEYAKSLDYMSQVLEPARQRGDKLLESAVLRNIGVSHLNLGDDLKCLEYLAQSLVVAREIKNRRQEAMVLASFGSTYSGMGEEQKAIDYYNQSLAIEKETGNKFGQVGILNTLGYSYYKMKDYQKALDLFNQGVEINKTLALRNLESTLQYQTGLVYAALKEYDKARDYFVKARASFAFMEANLQKFRADYMLAQIDKEEGKLDESQAKMQPILEFFESSRQQFIQPGQRSTYFSTAQNVYEHYIELMMAKYQKSGDKNAAAEAFQVSERTRARSLLELLSQAKIDLRQDANPELLDREKNLQLQISDRSSRLTRLLSGKFTEDQKAAAEKELGDFRSEYQEVEAKLLVGNKHYAELAKPSPLSLTDVQQQVVDEETTLLEYSLGKDKSYVFVITKDSFEAVELPKRAEIETKSRQVYELLTARNKNVKFETADKNGCALPKPTKIFQLR